MDLEKRIQQLQNDLNKRLENLGVNIEQRLESLQHESTDYICPQCGRAIKVKRSFCPYCAANLNNLSSPVEPSSSDNDEPAIDKPEKDRLQPMAKLPRYEEYEEETKSKIGTFEQIYENTYIEDCGRRLEETLGYEELDYAPLVNPLASAIEIELNATVYRALLSAYGKGYTFTQKEKTITLKKNAKTSLRDFQLLMEHDCKHKRTLSKVGLDKKQVLDCSHALNHIIDVRNDADHKKNISKMKFLYFYHNVFNFFSQYIESLLAIKKIPEYTSALNSELDTEYELSNMAPGTYANDEEYLSALNNYSIRSHKQAKREIRQGVIFYDSIQLTRKLFNVDIDTTKEEEICIERDNIRNVIDVYTKHMSNVDNYYKVLDVAKLYPTLNTEDNKWQDYAAALNDFCDKNFDKDITPAVFIIGGDDVIPMPCIANPFYLESDKEEDEGRNEQRVNERNRYFEKKVYADMMYAYYDVNDSDKQFIDNIVDYNTIAHSSPRYRIGRLPMENGIVDSLSNDRSPFAEFNAYFDRALYSYIHLDEYNKDFITGIDTSEHIAVTCESSKKCLQLMLEKIPKKKMDARINFIENDAFISPALDIRVPGSIKDDFIATCHNADMITILLHGSHRPSCYDFYGQNKDLNRGDYIGFSPLIYPQSNIKVINTLSCWGGRYVGFSKRESALLTAMYSSALLYLGASRSARATFDIHLDYNNNQISLALLLMKYYINYLMQGYAAGEAITRAKCDYLANPDFCDLDVLATVIQFNLYGDPLLSLMPVLEKQPVVRNVIDRKNYPFSSNSEFILKYDCNKKESLLGKVRGMVDKNLKEIREKINHNLYKQLNIDPESLQTIHAYTDADKKECYRFHYCCKGELFNNDTYVDTDSNGNIRSISSSL